MPHPVSPHVFPKVPSSGLAVRVIPIILYRNTQAVKSVQFRNHRNIGTVISQAKLYNSRNVDELILLDIEAYKNGVNWNVIKQVGEIMMCPFTVGGGIKTLDDAKRAISYCADKVSLSYRPENLKLMEEIASVYGKQAVVCSVDYRGQLLAVEAERNVCDYRTARAVNGLWATIRNVEPLCGEILLTSIEHEGTMTGYDLRVFNDLYGVEVPIILNGGAGREADFSDAVVKGASAVAASSIFQFTKITPRDVKKYMAKEGINVRL